MADNSYWSKRLKQEMIAKQASEADVDKAMSALYRVHQTNIEKEIQAFYQKYADDEGVSISEAKKRADKVDVQAFADKAKRYVEEKDFSPQANAELKLYNLKMRVSRAELLQYNMDLELLALGEGERQLTEKFLKAGFADEVKSQSGILGEYIKNPKTVERSMEAVLNVPFEGVTWSERIWERQQALRQVVARTAHETLVRGRNAMAMIPELRREFGVSKSAAKRLAVTEVARVQSEAQKISMIENGFDEYEYIAEPTACPICAKLDGNIYKVSEMEPGKNCAPMHPHCHCSTAPHMSREKNWDKIDKILNSNVALSELEEYNGDTKTSGAIYGAWNDKNDPGEKRRDAHAVKYYEAVRNRDTDNEVMRIAANTGFSEKDVRAVYEHVFENTHELEGGQGRFHPDYDMAQSWDRLFSGKGIQPHDITLLNHELTEKGLMDNEGLDYRTAHAITDRTYNYREELIKWKIKRGDIDA